MSQNNSGFVDLRIAHGGRGDDSVWPSFTDIMMVIVMIFLMTLAVMTVRNVELDRQLGISDSARHAGALERQRLADKILAIEAMLADLQRELAASAGKLALSEQALSAQALQGQALRQNLAATESALQTALARAAEADAARNLAVQNAAQLGDELAASQARFDALEARASGEIETLSAANLSLSEHLDNIMAQLEIRESRLRAEQQQRQAEQAAGRLSAATSAAELGELQAQYAALDEKYRGLVRPARSPLGKFLVEVYFLKTARGYAYRLKTPSVAAVDITLAALRQRLAALKKQHRHNLYTRVIIPESGPESRPENGAENAADTTAISHHEAWRFTQEILQNYDYYHQRGAASAPLTSPSPSPSPAP